VEGVQEVTPHEHGIDLLVVEARRLLPQLLAAVSADGIAIRSVEVVEPDLEAVFLHLTGKALRE
jgi:ABC-2 type transport system ATP-binding protein